MTEGDTLGDYVIQFKSVFLVPEIATAFYEFLKNEFATDNWDFILAVNNLQELSKKKNQSKILQQARYIYSLFIEPKSAKEISIGEEEKKKIAEEISNLGKKTWDIDTSPQDLFEPLKQLVLMEYKMDSFKRFSREKACMQLLEKHKGNRNVLLPQLSMLYNYKDEDFDSMVMEKKDKEFLDKFSHDNPNWKLIYTNKKTKGSCFKSTWNYFPNVSFLTEGYVNTKLQMIFDCSLQELACVVLSKYHLSDPNAQEVKVVEFKNQEFAVFQQNSNLGTSMFETARTKRVIYTLDYNAEKKQIVMKAKPSRIPDVPFLKPHNIELVVKKGEKPVVAKAIQYFTFYTVILTEIDDNRSMYEFIAAVDLGGNIMPDSILEKRLNGLHAAYSKKLSELGDRKTIKDFKYEFNELWEGIPVDPLGKLLYDLDIDRKDSEFQKKIEKRNQVFELSNYVVHFSAVNKPEINSEYHKFLKKEFNADSWEFINDYTLLAKYHQKKKEKQVQHRLKHILETYIEPKSPKHLGINSEEFNLIMESKSNPQKCIEHLKKVYLSLKMEHQLDSFKRFTKTPEAISILPKYQHDVHVMSPIFKFVTLCEPIDFQTPQISEKDVEFVIKLVDSAKTWDQIHSFKNATISMSKVNWFQNCPFVRPTSLVSFEKKFDFNYPIEQVANGYLTLTKLNKVDPNINKVKFIKYNEPTNEFYQSVVLSHDIIWTWKASFVKDIVSTFITHGDQLVFFSKPLQPPDGKWFKNQDDIIRYFQYEIVVLTKKDDFHTIFQHIYCIDSDEKIEWDKKIIERCTSFFPHLDGSISKSAKTVKEMKDIYEMKENGEYKDPLGYLLLGIDFSSLVVGEGTETEEDAFSSSTMTSYDDDEITSDVL